MSFREPITALAILNKFYAAERIYMAATPSNRDFSGMAATLSPNIRLVQSPDLPYGGVFEGHSAFLKWSQEMASRFDKVDVSDSKVLESGDDVVVLSTLKLKVRGSGEAVENPFVQKVTVDREEGVITEIRPFYWDVAGLNAALQRAEGGT